MKYYLLLFFLFFIKCDFMNPVIDSDAPDPGIIYYNGYYYVVYTKWNDEGYYPIRRSPDLMHWTQIGYVFNSTTKPSWSTNDVNIIFNF